MKASRTVVTAMVLALVAMACTHGASSSVQSQSNGPVTLKVWYYNESGPDVKFMNAVISAFQKKYPNMKVDLTVYPESNYPTKLNTAFAVNTVPDVANVYQQQWEKAGKFLPLNALIQQQHIDVSSFNQGIMSYCTLNGKIYCLSSYAGAVIMFYNRSMFHAAGVPYPSAATPLTVSQYVSDAEKLTNKAIGVWGTAFGTPVTWLPFSTVVSSDGRSVQGVVTSPETVQSYQQLADATRSGWAPTPSTMDAWNQGIDFFAQGKLAMVIGTLGGVNQIEHAGIDYGVAPTPVPPGSPPYIATFSNHFGVTAQAQHPQEGEEFVTFLASAEGQQLRMQMIGDIPISSQIAQTLNWAGTGESIGRQEALQVVNLAQPSVLIPTGFTVLAPLFDGFNAMVGGQSAQSVLSQDEPQIQANLTRAWSDWDQLHPSP